MRHFPSSVRLPLRCRRLPRPRWGIERVAALALILLFSPIAFARDLHGRLGLGYNAEYASFYETHGVPALSLKYFLTRDIGVEGIFGINTTTPRNSVIGAKFLKNIFYETDLNFYGTIGVGSLTANERSAAKFLGAFGTEFFTPGLESLGFSMEAGVSMDNLSGNFALKTLGVSFLNAGMHFYF